MEYEELLNLATCAYRVGVPIRWLKTEADAGRIPCLRVGRKRLFNTDAVRRALAEQAAHSTSPTGE